MDCKTFTSPADREIYSQRCYFFIFIYIYIHTLLCVNCNIVDGYWVPINSYLCQYWQHWKSAVFWAANEDKHTGIDTEKIATYALPLPHKNMHKIRLNTVFILFRASQISHLYPCIYFFACLILCLMFHIELFFLFEANAFCWLYDGEKQVICYSSISWHLLTVI